MTAAHLTALILLTTASTAAAQTGSPAPLDPPPIRVGPVTISGYLQVDALTTAGDDLEEARDTFRIRRARVAIGGDLAPKVGWAISAELSGSPHVRDAYLNLRFATQIQVRFGQFYPPSGLERLTSSSRLEVIDRTQLTERLTYERNPGVMVLNAEPYRGWVSYSVALLNGTGMNKPDENDAKDVAARIAVTPPMLEGLSIGVNGATGEQLLGDRTRSGVDVVYDIAAFKIAVEALKETFDGVPDRSGYYVLGAYRIRPAAPTPHFRMVEFAARYLHLDDPLGARDATPVRSFVPAVTKEIQFGGNYHVNRNVRFMANAIVPVDDRDAPDATFIGRLQILF